VGVWKFIIIIIIILQPYIHTYLHATHALYPKGQQKHFTYSLNTFHQNYLAISNTADMTDGKPIAVWSQSISGVNAINPLVAFYDFHGRKRQVLFFYFVLDTTRDSRLEPRHFFLNFVVFFCAKHFVLLYNTVTKILNILNSDLIHPYV
jgi:hypothetical protein